MDWNARFFATKIKNIDFNLMKGVLKRLNSDDKEFQGYIQVKAQMINETQTERIEQK